MTTITAATSTLLLIDFQTRLMPAISGGDQVIRNARRLCDAARIVDVPMLFTEQNPAGLGSTVPALADTGAPVVAKMSFDATRATDLEAHLADAETIVVAGCEAHVCVAQTVFGLLKTKRRICVVADSIGSRVTDNRDMAIARMRGHGAEIVTTEMVIFEWTATADHPHFRELVGLIKN